MFILKEEIEIVGYNLYGQTYQVGKLQAFDHYDKSANPDDLH